MHIAPLSQNHKKRIARLRMKKYRERNNLFLAEGMHALRDALRGNRYPVREVILADDLLEQQGFTLPAPAISGATAAFFSCPRTTVQELSTEEHSRGILLVCATMSLSLEDLRPDPPDRMIYLDGVSDPGNLGTILRTALWFGIDQVVLSPFCVDPYNTKVIRSSAGAFFHISLYRSVSADNLLSFARQGGFELAATAPRGGTSPRNALTGKRRQILLLGGEAQGMTSHLMQQAHRIISIPGSGRTESLNLAAAAAIILYELDQHRP